MTPVQSRMARAGLNWSAGDLALAAGVSRKAIMRFENHGVGGPAVRIAITRSLEAKGVRFIHHRNGIGVMLTSGLQDGEPEG